MSQLISKILIEFIETRVEAYSSDIPVANHVAISWTLAYVLCVLCFNGNMNYSRYFRGFTRSSLPTGNHMELHFDILFIADLIEMIGSPSKSLIFMVSELK